jgi:hypothetical protein
MDVKRGARSKNGLFVAIFGVLVGTTVYAADQGTTTGIAVFQAKGQVTEHKPGVIVWVGSFVGVSTTESRKGLLHNSGWECTGEATISEGKAYQQDGFCLVTDTDGDTVNLVWERTDLRGGMAGGKTKGTYLSGTGKYTGIQGYYTFSCQHSGAMDICNITGGEYKVP